MLYTDVKSVSSTYRVIYHAYALYRCEICLSYVQIMYCICMSLSESVCSTYRVLYHIYMLFTASSRSVCSTFRFILYYYVYFLQPLLGLPLAHTELILHVCEYMPFTDLKSASSTYVLDFYHMPPLKCLGHTTFLC